MSENDPRFEDYCDEESETKNIGRALFRIAAALEDLGFGSRAHDPYGKGVGEKIAMALEEQGRQTEDVAYGSKQIADQIENFASVYDAVASESAERSAR